MRSHSRRQLLISSAAAGATLVGLAGAYHRRHQLRGWFETLGAKDYQLITQSVKVPTDFLGMHFHRWPDGTPLSPAPQFQFGSVRSHDYDINWYHVELSPGVYDWQKMDRWVEIHIAKKRTLLYTVYGTPEWLATDPTMKDPYGHHGGASPPKDLTKLSEFIKALISRYNTPSVPRIKLLEVWNEPVYRVLPTDFWWGSPSEMVGVAGTIFRAAKAQDPRIKILSPGFAGMDDEDRHVPLAENLATKFLVATDKDGKTGAEYCEAISVHFYDDLPGVKAGLGIEGCVYRLRDCLQRLSLDLPIYTTELGFQNPESPFVTGSISEKASLLRRTAAIQAALGVKAVYFYSYDDDYAGNPARHPEIVQAFRDIQNDLCGATLVRVIQRPDGTVNVSTTAKSFVW